MHVVVIITLLNFELRRKLYTARSIRGRSVFHLLLNGVHGPFRERELFEEIQYIHIHVLLIYMFQGFIQNHVMGGFSTNMSFPPEINLPPT